GASSLSRNAPLPPGPPPDGGPACRRGSRLSPAAPRRGLEVRELGTPLDGAGRPLRGPLDGPAAARLRRRGGRPGTPRAVLLIAVGAASVLALEAIPFYTDWLWFEEVGYVPVFLQIAATRGGILIAVGLLTFLFLAANVRAAVRARPPDVFWELEE